MTDRHDTLSTLVATIREPLCETERLLSKILFRCRYGDGIDVMDRDWDTLIILDACRADFFAEHNTIDGSFQTVVSSASTSSEFIESNFAGRELHETIYVTANPFVEMLSDDVFFRVYYTELFDHWDTECHTIPPEAVVDGATRMHRQYPEKRLIVHFMQPHAPYIGETGRELHEAYDFGVFNPNLKTRAEFDIPDESVLGGVRNQNVPEKLLRQAYSENVRIVLRYAEELVAQLDGRSVITADHGEMLGERVLITKEYAHLRDRYTPELRVVPWFVVDCDERRTITAGEPSGFDRLDDEIRESRLGALGYTS